MADKVAIVTASGRGMGATIARHLAGRGYRLAMLSPSGAASTLARELGGLGVDGSVTDPDDLKRLVHLTLERWGRIDALVNNTGHPPKGELLELTDQDWHLGLDMVVLNVVRIARLVTPHMIEQGGGAIVNVSSFAAFEPSPVFPVSSALRAALGGFTKMYADRYAIHGIRMNNILPGFVDSHPVDPRVLATIPMGRYATTEEIARAVAFLLSEESSYITGQNIRVDGGVTRSV